MILMSIMTMTLIIIMMTMIMKMLVVMIMVNGYNNDEYPQRVQCILLL